VTTPADWRLIIPQLQDRESIQLTQRLVAFQREWLDAHAAQLDQVTKLLEEQAGKIDRQAGA
jgi:hypothetical protein